VKPTDAKPSRPTSSNSDVFRTRVRARPRSKAQDSLTFCRLYATYYDPKANSPKSS